MKKQVKRIQKKKIQSVATKAGGGDIVGVILQHVGMLWIIARKQGEQGEGRPIKCIRGGVDRKRNDDSSNFRRRGSKALTDGQ